MERPSIWVRDEFSASIYPPFSFILTLTGAVKWWFSRALQRSFQEMSTNDRWKNIAFDFINAPIALVNNYWATLGNILCFFLPKNQRYCFFWSHVLVTSCLTGEKKESLGNWYHPLCLKCKKCGRQLATGSHAEVDYCTLPYTLYEFRIFSVINPQHSVFCTAQYSDNSLPLCYISTS